jgi:hypothetical protein
MIDPPPPGTMVTPTEMLAWHADAHITASRRSPMSRIRTLDSANQKPREHSEQR